MTHIAFPQIAFPNKDAEAVLKRIAYGEMPLPLQGTSGIILHGAPGNGKSTVAVSFAEQFQATLDSSKPANVQVHNLMKPNNGVSFINSIKQQCYNWSIGDYHYQVVNEIDNLTPDAMKQFKCVMDDLIDRKTGVSTVIWVFTTNHVESIDAGLLDRCIVIDYDPTGPLAWIPFATQELAKRGKTMTNLQVASRVIAPSGNSLRGVIRQIELV